MKNQTLDVLLIEIYSQPNFLSISTLFLFNLVTIIRSYFFIIDTKQIPPKSDN
jgi:hypothetical protein